MIEKIEIKKDTVDFHDFTYLEDLDFFKKNRTIKFKKGINLLLSHNGKGKSTLLNIIATGLAAKQGGYSKVTDPWTQQVFSCFNQDRSFSENFNIVHDGQGIIYQNPRDPIGLNFGAFDNDFFNEGLSNTLSKSSTGLTTIERMNLMFDLFLNNKYPLSDIKFNHSSPSQIEISKLLSSQIEKGQRTLLLDEPESGLALNYQYRIFDLIQTKAEELDLQIIISTHSPCLFLFDDPNIIELSDDYLNHVEESMAFLSLSIKLKNKIKEFEQQKK